MMNKEELREILDQHRAWLDGNGGTRANLEGANLEGANLRSAYLRSAYLGNADLRGADLVGAIQHHRQQVVHLRGANLWGANLVDAKLVGAKLVDAKLVGAKLDPIQIARLSITPSDGAFIGWKKVYAIIDDSGRPVIAKLEILADAKRSNATGRKCRAEAVRVLELFGANEAYSGYDPLTIYRVGEIVRCHEWCNDRWQECAGGIHFFMTREEAEEY